MPKIQEANERFYVTIPKDIVRFKGWGKGDILDFQEIGGYVCILQAEPGSKGTKSNYRHI